MKTLTPYLLLLLCMPLNAQHTESKYCHSGTFYSQKSHSPQHDGQFDMKYLFIDLAADNLSTAISGSATLLVELTDDSSEDLHLELVDALQVSQVTVNSQTVSFSHADNLLSIARPAHLTSGSTANIRISYSGIPNPASSGIFSGINNAASNAWGNQITWTLSEPFNAKSWWPAKQDLNDKIDSVRVHITTDSHLKVGSNGVLTKTTNLVGGKTRYEWKSNYPIAYYLVAFTVGEYVEYNHYARPQALENDSILIQNYIYDNPETLPYYEDELDMVPEMLTLFSDLFGLYPFHQEKYGHVMAPFSGGMEHQTMSSMGIFTFGLSAHELGHQWFGDYVTCATWNDIWINEGFARFCEYIATEKLLSVKNARAVMTDDMLSVTGTDTGSVYIPQDQPLTDARIFSYRLTYLKGGLIINMMRRLVNNDEVFFAAMRAFLAEYANKSATGEDFRLVLEQETAMDFESFFDQWYYGGGFPIFDITWTKLPGDTLGISVSQSTSDDIALFTTPLEFKITFESGQVKKFYLTQSENIQYFKVPASGKVKSLKFDEDNWLIKIVNSFNQVDENGNVILTVPPDSPVIYPNPADRFVYLGAPVRSVRFIDAAGRNVLLVQLGRNERQIDISQLEPGLYYYQAENGATTWNGKLLKR